MRSAYTPPLISSRPETGGCAASVSSVRRVRRRLSAASAPLLAGRSSRRGRSPVPRELKLPWPHLRQLPLGAMQPACNGFLRYRGPPTSCPMYTFDSLYRCECFPNHPLWQVTTSDFSRMEPVIGIETIQKERWELSCCVCRQRMGAKIQCASCYTAYHPLCGRMAGLQMEMREHPDGNGQLQFMSYCPKHCRPRPELSGMRGRTSSSFPLSASPWTTCIVFLS